MKGIISPKELGKRKLWIPCMSVHAYPLAAMFRRVGINAEALPPTTDESLVLAREQLSGDQCLPCFTTLGDFLRRVKEKDFDATKEAFFQATTSGPCRYGQYIYLHRQILDRMGLQDVKMTTLSSANAYGGMGAIFKVNALAAMVVIDYMYKLLWKTRPYEKKKGMSDEIFERYVHEIADEVEHTKAVVPALKRKLKQACEEFMEVPKRKEKRPLIGIVGEIYVRWNAFSNQDLVRQVEQMGGEAWIAPFVEWVEYLIVMNQRKGSGKQYLAQEKIMKFLKWQLWQPLKEYLDGRFDDWAEDAIDAGSDYVEEVVMIN